LPRQQTNKRRELVATQILEEAAALFAKKGFAATSLQDVAEALGISRTALYHYIGNKDDLLAQLVHGLTQETAEELERFRDSDELEPAPKLAAAVRGMALRIARNPSRFRLLLMSEPSLEGVLAEQHADARRRALAALTAIIEEGVQSGVLRPVDAHLAAFSVLGMCNWIAWWHRVGDERHAPDEIAQAMADVALSGLGAASGRSAPTKGDPVEHALDLVREDLQSLEHVVRAQRRPPD
jgi:AcrR family transcriptional regulator